MPPRQRVANGKRATDPKPSGISSSPVESKGKRVSLSAVVPVAFDFYNALALVFGGCCSNVLTYEQLLLMNPGIGSALTFSQMLFIALQSLPSFLTLSESGIPRLKPRQVPLRQWALQVLVFTTGSLLNNWAFAYKVPLTILIVFRSGGLPISILFGYFVNKKRYSMRQILSVFVVFTGVILVTLSKSPNSTDSKVPRAMAQEELRKYLLGISMMAVSLLCTGLLGVLQERTYQRYGPCWKEGVFYTHFLSLPAFFFLREDIKRGFVSLSSATSHSAIYSYAVLFGNLLSQLICVSGVNQLSSQVSSVSTNVVLTVRKAISLCLSVWWFGNEWNAQLGLGAAMVFFGSLLYTLNPGVSNKKV
ncbi:UAA transporter [Crepidotus variabilis]|uniref:UAA transporter n=1 Tax=Crepidotus variabilis TaxID=179855 RepID=A0A9P6ETS0_9AGAR|nr:UAA transporter [Crepidotus variabilis]